MPLAWFFDATIYVDEIDETYYYALDNILKGYKTFRKGYFNDAKKGSECIVVEKIVRNKQKTSCKKFLTLFSGGVDAWDTLIDVIFLKPIMLTIWGSDIFPGNSKAWDFVKQTNSKIAGSLALGFTHIKTNFRGILNYGIIHEYIKSLHPNFNDYWWSLQHGLALIGMTAPLAHVENIGIIFIGSSQSLLNHWFELSASNPFIDDNIKFGSTITVHKSFQKSRNDKIRNIIKYSKLNNHPLRLRVCWERMSGENCCICEKCLRTWLAILSEGFNPMDFGFDLNEAIIKQSLDSFVNRRITVSKYWDETINNFKGNKYLLDAINEENIKSLIPSIKEIVNILT